MKHPESNVSLLSVKKHLSSYRIYTCTPVSFHYRQDFLIRDTGLFATQLRSIGIESKSIMPLPWHDDDIRDDGHLIRVELKKLYSASWWRTLNLDGLILYSWGAPRYTGIARAAKRAGIRVHVHLDTADSFFRKPEGLFSLLKYYAWHFLTSRHVASADVITIGAPLIDQFQRHPFFGKAFTQKALPIPCPVADSFDYDGTQKENTILFIGRWSDERQKRTKLMMQTLNTYYAVPRSTVTEIYGKLTDELKTWHAALPEHIRTNIRLQGYVPNAELRAVYRRSRAIICTSSFESSHIVSAEMLCCGGAVITPRRPGLANLVWYTTGNSGSIAEEDTAESLASAIATEMGKWDSGQRVPQQIADHWQPYFHATKVIPLIFPFLKSSALQNSDQAAPNSISMAHLERLTKDDSLD